MSQNAEILHDYKTHFAFGENWKEYSQHINPARIESARDDLARLTGTTDLSGKTFLDIGSGSGLHSLCALSMNAKKVTAVDIDENSLATTKDTLARFAPNTNYECRIENILAETRTINGPYDIVYSWGVLHHTGDMWRAIENASALVKPGGKFIIAIYRKTPLCRFWEKEKKFYTSAPKFIKSVINLIYAAGMIAGYTARGINPMKKIKTYGENRGMSWWHDCIDWLGGWPYESAGPEDIESYMNDRGFKLQASFNTRKKFGLFGTGCAEYVFEKI